MPTFTNPVIDEDGTDHGDPFALRHLDWYYLFHTTDDGDAGISVHRSRDLVTWEPRGFALEAGGPDHWAQTDLWAPEVMYWRGWFFMYVTGTRFGPDGEGDRTLRRIGLARSRTPEGPYELDPEPLLAGSWGIDGHPFQDEDGSLWLFYNVRSEGERYLDRPGSGNVVDRLLDPGRLAGRPQPVAFPSEPWEGDREQSAFWNEGAWVLKRRGRYYHLYSGGTYRDETYGIGLTAADRPHGPWQKEPGNPIFRSGERITGPGHHSVILARDGVTYYAVYHGYHDAKAGRQVHLDELRWCGDRPLIGTGGRPTEGEQPVPPGPVHDEAVPTWHADLWVTGRRLELPGTRIELREQEAPVRVRISQGREGLRVWADGRLCHQADGLHRPELRADGEVLSPAVTSHLEDEAIRWLAPGERQRWPWGGSGPLELTLAVRGACRIRAGDVEERFACEGDRPGLARLAVPDGAEAITVTGDGPGAHVTDLAVTAR